MKSRYWHNANSTASQEEEPLQRSGRHASGSITSILLALQNQKDSTPIRPKKLFKLCLDHFRLRSRPLLQRLVSALWALIEPVAPDSQSITERDDSFFPRATRTKKRKGRRRYRHGSYSQRFGANNLPEGHDKIRRPVTATTIWTNRRSAVTLLIRCALQRAVALPARRCQQTADYSGYDLKLHTFGPR